MEDMELLKLILNQEKCHTTFSMTFVRRPFKVLAQRSFLFATPIYPLRFSKGGSLNFLILNGESPTIVFDAVRNATTLQPSQDNNLIYQWKNYSPGSLYRQELINFKFKSEIVYYSDKFIKSNLYCFYCNGGNPQIITQSNRQLNFKTLFTDFTKNFFGKILRFSTSKRNPILVNFRIAADGTWEYFGGVSTPILTAIKFKLNCSISTHPDSEYGTELPNGSYSGVIGEIAAGNIDIAVLAQHYDRHRVAYFSHLIVTGNVVLSTRRPIFAASFNAIFYAFTVDAWYLFIGLCFGIVLPSYVILCQVSGGKSKNFKLRTSLGKALNFIYMPLLEQDLPKSDMPNITTRVFFVFWLFFVLIVSTAYKSKLRDLMIQGLPEYLPTTFDELVEMPEFEINARSFGGALTATLKAIQTPTFKKIVKRMNSLDVTGECIGKALKKSHAVCICYREVLELVSYKNFSNKSGQKLLQISPESKSAFYLHGCIATHRNAVFKESVDEVVHLAYASFLPQYSIVKDFRHAQSQGRLWARTRKELEFDTSGHDGPNPLQTKHFKLIFILLFAGLGIATLTYLADIKEKIMCRFKQNIKFA